MTAGVMAGPQRSAVRVGPELDDLPENLVADGSRQGHSAFGELHALAAAKLVIAFPEAQPMGSGVGYSILTSGKPCSATVQDSIRSSRWRCEDVEPG